LPLRNVRRIGVFGTDADYPPTGSGCGPDLFCTVASKTRYWNGTVTIGGGSGAAYADYIASLDISAALYANHQAAPLEAISLRARREGIRVDTVLHDEAAHFESMTWIASQSEVCLVFVSVFLVEAWDRKELRLDHDGEEMIKTIEKSCAGQVVIVMHVGGQVIVEDWVSRQIDYADDIG
jgi:beta-glucosidase